MPRKFDREEQHMRRHGADLSDLSDVDPGFSTDYKPISPFDGVVGEVGVGSSGADVKRIQQGLGIKADGLFGPQTEQAVKDFQASIPSGPTQSLVTGIVNPEGANGGKPLAVDGIVGPETSKLMADRARSPALGLDPYQQNQMDGKGVKSPDGTPVTPLPSEWERFMNPPAAAPAPSPPALTLTPPGEAAVGPLGVFP